MIFKALSVVTPAGDRIRSGQKTLEIRQWQPENLPLKNLVIVQNLYRLSSVERPHDPDGMVVAVVDITGTSDWTEDQLSRSCSTYWELGWTAWHLSNIRPVTIPVIAPARLRIYDIEIPDSTVRGMFL
ncbi:MAG: ASCH domain-containing protein [Verrucomicrobiales bacterium]|nr:ASCH domain-containing protein [Verrucomicrobiales bacterium]